MWVNSVLGHVCTKHFTWSKIIPSPHQKYCLTSSIYFLNIIYFEILKLKVIAENVENENKKKTLIGCRPTDNTINTGV